MAAEDLTLDARQLAYLDWICVPAPNREPSSKKAYATLHQVDITTLRRWEKLSHFRREWEERLQLLQGNPERTQKLLDSLYERAFGSQEKCPECGQRGGETRAAELWGKWTGQLKAEVAKVEVSRAASDLSDAELDALIAKEAQDELAARRAKTGAA
jgi:hypothetical protein